MLLVKMDISTFKMQEKLKGVSMPDSAHPRAISVELLSIKLKYLNYRRFRDTLPIVDEITFLQHSLNF